MARQKGEGGVIIVAQRFVKPVLRTVGRLARIVEQGGHGLVGMGAQLDGVK
jgi:hypothetical protein